MHATVIVPVLKKGRGGRSASDGQQAVTRTPESRLEEAIGLAQAIDLDVVNGVIVPVNDPRPATLLGTGKLE